MAEGTAIRGRRLPGGHAENDCTGCTARPDAWWKGPTATFLGLMAFAIYATWGAFQGEHYIYENYLSPFCSPVLFTEVGASEHTAEDNKRLIEEGHAPADSAHVWFGSKPEFWPKTVHFSPAFFILIFPGAFRFTCYYYRKAYYRSFWANPVGCAVGPFRRGKYRGETFLLLFQNLHRYAMYAAVVFIFILAFDALHGFYREGQGVGIGVGSLVLVVNVLLLSGYTFGCHSFRHLVGGRKNLFSRSALGHAMWKMSTKLNEKHMNFAWLSLFWVGFTDFYVRMVSMGYITDLSTWG